MQNVYMVRGAMRNLTDTFTPNILYIEMVNMFYVVKLHVLLPVGFIKLKQILFFLSASKSTRIEVARGNSYPQRLKLSARTTALSKLHQGTDQENRREQ